MPNGVRLNKQGLTRLIMQSPGDLDDAIDRLALEGQRIAQESMGTSPAGRRYKRGTVIHIASVPGYPPNVHSGKLRNAIHVERPGALQRVISTGDAEHAAHQEFGTTKMAARPFMRPMVKRLQNGADRFLRGVIR
jgi:HK97 gp10 family phage protein